MRRSEKEITDKAQIEEILRKAAVIRLAMVDNGEPYIVAMNFAYDGNFIYLHSAMEGRKINIFEKNGKVAFQTEIDAETVLSDDACSCTARYRSIFGTGKITLLRDMDEKIRALDLLMLKYNGKSGYKYPDKSLDRTMGIRLEIESVTGKKSGF